MVMVQFGSLIASLVTIALAIYGFVGILFGIDVWTLTCILYKFFIVRDFASRTYCLLFGYLFLFGGAYCIYRERLIIGSTLFGLGSLLGFWALLPVESLF
jgi:hypothetical protein